MSIEEFDLELEDCVIKYQVHVKRNMMLTLHCSMPSIVWWSLHLTTSIGKGALLMSSKMLWTLYLRRKSMEGPSISIWVNHIKLLVKTILSSVNRDKRIIFYRTLPSDVIFLYTNPKA
jgi:hypothetical protein